MSQSFETFIKCQCFLGKKKILARKELNIFSQFIRMCVLVFGLFCYFCTGTFTIKDVCNFDD